MAMSDKIGFHRMLGTEAPVRWLRQELTHIPSRNMRKRIDASRIQNHLVSPNPLPHPDVCLSGRDVNCADIVTQGNVVTGPAGPFYHAYILGTDINVDAGLAGVQFGIEYGSEIADGVALDILQWNLCGYLQFNASGWPHTGSSVLITWDDTSSDPLLGCQRFVPAGNDPANGAVAVAGYFYCGAYSPAELRITPATIDGTARVVSCGRVEDVIEGAGVVRHPSHLGIAGWGMPGYNPCGLATPITPTTWTR